MNQPAILGIKTRLKQFKEQLSQQFSTKTDITHYSNQLCQQVDDVLITLFRKNKLDKLCLLAVGGYGRRELLLHSDIDLLILHTEDCSDADLNQAQSFIQDIWDIGLEPGHQITTVKHCSELAAEDITVITTLMDMRLLCGPGELMTELQNRIHPSHMWPFADFFLAKQREQQQRYLKYSETAYNLEPNVKLGAGGLRDLQALLAINKRFEQGRETLRCALGDTPGHRCTTDKCCVIQSEAKDLSASYPYITQNEYAELTDCQHALWRVRFALHILAGKREDRLQFEYQVPLAALFGYVDASESLAIEQFMKMYFKIIKQSREITEMLLQGFSEALIPDNEKQVTLLDSSFQLINNVIEVTRQNVFSQRPAALLELFLWIAKRPEITGIRASTIRLLRQHVHLMSKAFCASHNATNIFLDIFRSENSPYEALQYMNKHGVLGHYLDCFAAVTGQMQYDLFHIFTVDQHTLFVIRNLARFLNPDYAKQFPLAASIMQRLEKKDTLYFAALFHDIAKGRGGDHSELGADEAQIFADRHRLSAEDSKLLVWLVRHHLLMSHTAQRQDIYDPKTINKFCSLLPEPDYVDYLYLLTVADICATNQTLWNSWKDSLLKELYNATIRAQQEKKSRLNESAMIEARQQEALALLQFEQNEQDAVIALWQGIKSRYFLHESAGIIAQHTRAILECQSYPLVLILPHHSQGGTEVLVYMPHRDDRFTITTTVLSNQRVTIQEATILTCDNQFDIDTYVILDEKNQAFLDDNRASKIKQALVKQLQIFGDLPGINKQRQSRTQAHFYVAPRISLIDDEESNSTCLFLIATDKPGLLARVSRIFSANNLHLHSAKISTAGERAEDTFYISSASGKPLNDEEKARLHKGLCSEL